MRAVRLLRDAISKQPEKVLDVGVHTGKHAMAFIAGGAEVTGIDVTLTPFEHPKYSHVSKPFEYVIQDGILEKESFDMVWCSHTIEHIPNVQSFLVGLHYFLRDDGWLYIAAPTNRQNRLHIGHLTLWTPAHLVYNLICAGWDCREAKWYTEYCTIGLCVQRRPEIDLSWRTSLPSEIEQVNEYAPKFMGHNDGAWWGNNWHEETIPRVPDPPLVTVGEERTNLPPELLLALGPNPALRKRPGIGYDSDSNTAGSQ